MENLLSWAEFKKNKELKKTDGTKTGRILGIPKLEDANDAGGRNSEKCTLILTEGDSAKALAVSLTLLDYKYGEFSSQYAWSKAFIQLFADGWNLCGGA